MTKSRNKSVSKKKTVKKTAAPKKKVKKALAPKKPVKKANSNVMSFKKKSKVAKVTLKKTGNVAKLGSKTTSSRKPVIKKKKSLKIVSKKTVITPEQKAELEKLHQILSDSFVRQMLIEIGGENALVIVRNFYGNHSDEELSKRLELRISDVRATLNKLHNEGLVKYARTKDSETGWYSYAWTLNRNRIVEWVAQYSQKANGMNGDDGIDYYFCPSCGLSSIIEFEEAHDNEFKCGKCTKSLEFVEEQHFASINQLLRKTDESPRA
jgi:transcription factor E